METQWVRRISPGIATLGAMVVVAATTVGADTRSWSPPPCGGSPGVVVQADRDDVGAWFQEDPLIVDGSRAGTALAISIDGASARVLTLPSESFAAGPYGDMILVGSDDGRTSSLTLLDATRGCAWPVGASSDVIRRASLAPDGQTIYETRVARATRADLGIWRRPVDGRTKPARILAPLPPDDRFGRTFSTGLTWSADGRVLAVRSCGELACRLRVLDPITGRHRLLADPTLGDIVGLTADRVVVRGACRGLPCAIVSVPLDGGDATLLESAAGVATMTTLADGTSLVVMEIDRGERSLRAAALDGATSVDLGSLRGGRRLVPLADSAGRGDDLPPGWVAIAPDDSIVRDATPPAEARHVPDGRTVALDEVPR